MQVVEVFGIEDRFKWIPQTYDLAVSDYELEACSHGMSQGRGCYRR